MTFFNQESMHHQRRVYINGRFLSQPASGVQRFARELVKAVDARLGQLGPASVRPRWTLLVPKGTTDDLALQHIDTEVRGGGSGHAWDQGLHLAGRRHDVLVNLANSGPIWRARSLVVVHDAAVFRTPENFTLPYARLHQWLGRRLARRSVIGTVSEFSRQELSEVLALDRERIFTVANSCEHLRHLEADTDVVARLNLQPQRYFLFIGSPAPNKNLITALNAFTRLRSKLPGTTRGALPQFVIVGASNQAVLKAGLGAGPGALPEGALLAGRLSDREIKGLLSQACALVFPSVYEGFGLPPLEAMATRCPVIASDIPPVAEVCGEAALLVPVRNPIAMASAMREVLERPELRADLIARGEVRAARYAWSRSARSLMEAVSRVA